MGKIVTIDTVAANAARDIASALAGAEKGAKVKIVFADSFARRATLPEAQVRNLSHDELAAALCYELEPFGALPPADAVTGVRKEAASAPSQAAFSVAQVPRTAFDAARAAVANAACIFSGAESADGIPLGDASPERAARKFSSVHCMLLAAFAVLLGTAWDWYGYSNELAARKRDVAEREALQARIAGERRAEQDATSKRESIMQERIETLAVQKRAAALRAAAAELLGAAAAACGERAVVREIAPTDAGDGAFLAMKISAVSLSANDASQAMMRLDSILTPKGWHVATEDVANDGASCRFACVCRFAGDAAGEGNDD
ncbi:MAG: hypothetical protein IJ802_04920 [Kiritimatiellae bacterium]|nr:hypothetical protein [Kiritimatiellia bacterium]